MIKYGTPLRYPGGKAALAGLVREILNRNQLQGGILVEPYAGGAGASIKLLLEGHVSELWLNDKDIGVRSFWQSVLREGERFCEQIQTCPFTLPEYDRQREIQKNPGAYTRFEVGFATFYLNRTSRSGIIRNAGPIGGRHQQGRWRLHARFNRDALADRVALIATHADQIRITGSDAIRWLRGLNTKLPAKRSLVFLDPPYFNKGRELYLNAYREKDHRRLAEFLQQDARFPWILTYDAVEAIRQHYQDRQMRMVDLRYSAARKRRARELLIMSDRTEIPCTPALDQTIQTAA